MPVPLLKLHQVSKTYHDGWGNEVDALRNICFTLEEGEFLTILGPSGCGKSTLLRIIAGLLPPSGGRCLYKGEPIRKPSLERGYVFQEPRLFPWLTVLENIGLGGGSAQEIVEKMDLQGFGEALPHELSGGMAQRVALARALAAKPKLLLLDEPLASLDSHLRSRLQMELRRIWQQEGVTCILVTHDIEEALALGTRLMVLSRRPGRVLIDQSLAAGLRLNKEQVLAWMEG
ncbi:MAG: ATP-binding cassette domain-containing protein [Bacillota bacterium]|jgi:ABC-type nitrate/sulfonate/bicarbonate transport system ATPase subunit|nr:ATP-binding cassette domain-containing protein [Bacillota bacterium]HHT90678.1 ATP-binding cassette domain-containing protein [Bacillota bacterium]